MIPQIEQRYFPAYATLHQATVTLNTMGDRTITTQLRIDGDITPEFGVTENGVFHPMELIFKGERFILPVREPQATKDNSTRNSLVDLTFYSWPIHEMKRYFFVEMASVSAGTAIADKYIASLALDLEDFVDAFNRVLDYYFDGTIQMDLFQAGQGFRSNERAYVDINYSYIWDVLQKMNEIYDVRWWIEESNGVYHIKVDYTADGIDDHDFEYGYQGGLLKFERQLQDDTLTNILLGRGGEKNLPYRYFKLTDPENPDWAADPDAIPELANIYFDRLRDVNFRWYVRGWMQNSHRDTSWDSTHTYPVYAISPSSPYYWAFERGRTDEKFNPVEYVKDDDSIARYGEHWGALDDNDDIFPTIQGVTLSGLGRVDEAVAISEIVTDDIMAYAKNAAIETSLRDMSRSVKPSDSLSQTIQSDTFVIPTGQTGNITYRPFSKELSNPNFVYYNTTSSRLRVISATTGQEASTTGSEGADGSYSIAGIPAGTWRLQLDMVLTVVSPATSANGTFGIENVVVTTSATDTNSWKPTFDIWVKNIWQTTKGVNETPEDYSERVWGPILGDRVGNEAKVVFSSGPMAASQDYEFVIASYPEFDQSKTIITLDSDGRTTISVQSEWKITVYKSNAEFDATGLYIPNAQSAQPVAGNHFFFTGIDMPHMYVLWAEERLNANKENALDGMSETNPSWLITLDKVRVNTLEDGEYGQTLADRLATGITVRTTDPRFTPGQVLTLYVQSLTYTWNEPTKDSPYLVPDIEVVLSDKPMAVENSYAKLQSDVSVISQSYVDVTEVETAVRKVAGALFLKKTGESDSSASPTAFSSKVTSANFRKGSVGGRGWGIYEDNRATYASDVITQASPSRGLRTRAGETAAEEETPEVETRSVIEVDKLVVRQEMEVNTLVVNQIEYRGGKEIISAAKIEVSLVVETNDSYICYFDQKQNSVANLFQVNDIAYGQVWQADNSSLRFYKMRVSAVDINSITLAKSGRVGGGVPAIGDVIVQYGNTTNVNRQYVILRDVIGGGYEQMLSGLNSPSAAGNEYYFAGALNTSGSLSPRWFVGDVNGEFAEWYNGQLNIKGRVTVLGNNGTYISLSTYIDSIKYLTEAFPLMESTLFQGGLILTSMMQLGYTVNDSFVVMSGINGYVSPDTPVSQQASTIAAWFGGPMVDHENDPYAGSYAKSLFRMDGSGYLAGGAIHWNSVGNGGIPGITWQGNDIVISGNVKLASTTGDSVTSLITAIQGLNDMFELDGNGDIHVKNNKGFYSDSFISAGGLSPTQGGAGGASVLDDLNDVTIGTLAAGQVLKCNGVDWENAALELGELSNVDLTTTQPAAGKALIYDGTNWVPGDATGGGMFFGVCHTSGSSVNKVVTIDGFTSANIAEGTTIVVFMSYANTVDHPYLVINGTTATPVLRQAVTAQYSQSLAYWWGSTEMVQFTYHGEGWMIGGGKTVATNTSYGLVRQLNTVSELETYRLSYGYTGSAALLYEIYTIASSGGGGGGGGTTYLSGTGISIDSTHHINLVKSVAATSGTTGTIGGVIPAAQRNVSYSNFTIGGTTSGRYYGVEMNSAGQLFVNVPWESGGGGGGGSYLPLSGGTMAGTINSQDVLPKDSLTYNLGGSSKYWNNLYTKRIYLSSGVYVEYDSTNNCVYVHGAGIASDSFISAGGVSNDGDINLSDMADISGTPSNGQVLVYNSSTRKWVPTTLS